MKLARCETADQQFWALVDVKTAMAQPIVGQFADWSPALMAAINAGDAARGEAELPRRGEPLPLSELRLLPPIEPVNRVVVAGANYAKHLAEDFGLAAPSQPVAFLKSFGALIGANDPIRYPPLTNELDHEVELVVCIGQVPVDLNAPMQSVLGYTVGNDVSARDLQRSGPKGIGMDLFAAKSQDQSSGVGPWLVTRDEFGDDSPALRMMLTVDDDIRQDGSSGDMTWGVAELLSFVEQRSSFAAGDIMFTGSPDGVGQGTGKFLKPGEMVEASIEGIGALHNRVSARAE